MVSDLYSLGKKIRDIETRTMGYEQDFLPNSSEEVFGLTPVETVNVAELSFSASKKYVVGCDLTSVNLDNTIQPYSDVLLDLDTGSNPSSGVVSDFSLSSNNGSYSVVATAYYPFNGNANDESVNSNNGTVTGATLTVDHLGSSNNAYNFGNGQYITLTTPTCATLTSTFTINFWNKRNNQVTTFDDILKTNSWSTAGGFAIFTQSSDNRLGVSLKNAAGATIGAYFSSPTNGEYSMYTIVSTGALLSLYKDGVFVDSVVMSGVYMTDTGSLSISDSGNTDFDMSSLLLIGGVALNNTDVANLYAYTSQHKLDKPLITKTDSDGKSITGYEFIGDSGSNNFYNNIDTDFDFTSTVLQQTGTYSVYIEFMPLSLSRTNQTIWGNINSGSNRHSLVLNNTSLGFQRYNGTAYTGLVHTISDKLNKVVKVLCVNDGGTLSLYVDGVSVGSVGNNYVGLAAPTFRIGYLENTTNGTSPFVGVIGVPLIIDRVLTSNERTKLFNNGRLTGYNPFVLGHPVNGDLGGEFYLGGDYCSETLHEYKTSF